MLNRPGDEMFSWQGAISFGDERLYRKRPETSSPAQNVSSGNSRCSAVIGLARREWIAILGAITEQQDGVRPPRRMSQARRRADRTGDHFPCLPCSFMRGGRGSVSPRTQPPSYRQGLKTEQDRAQ